MKQFILIDHEPWTVRRKQLFYDLFEQAGLKLEVWDLSQMLYPGFSNPDEIETAPYLKRIYTEKELLENLVKKDPKNTIIVEEIFRIWKNRKVFKAISKYNFQTIKIELYGNTTLKENLWYKVQHIYQLNLKELIKSRLNSLRMKLYNKINNIKPKPDFLFSSNALDARTDNFNHPDYENYRFKTSSRIIEGDYIVFCDIYFPYHTDRKYFYNDSKQIDGKKYHQLMSQYFDYLEDKYNLPVVIAAHPKSEYKGTEFGNRRIIKYQTDNLVRYASMVTMHHCNSISYAILGNKPIAFIATEDYLHSIPMLRRKFKNLANRILHLPIYVLDNDKYRQDFEFQQIDDNIRRDYTETYLTSPETENISNVEILKMKLLIDD